jgi:hypothetical protein
MQGFLTKLKSTTTPPNVDKYQIKPFISENNPPRSKMTIVRKAHTDSVPLRAYKATPFVQDCK